MVYRAFGKTGWRVSQVGLGCWQFGGAIMLDGKPDGWSGVSDEESVATIKRAVELGINFFDTSDMYGWGHSEGYWAAPSRRSVTATAITSPPRSGSGMTTRASAPLTSPRTTSCMPAMRVSAAC